MTVKLNLTMAEDTATAIKKYANQKNTSVSKIAEELFKKTLKEDKRKLEAQQFIDKYAGIAKGTIGDNLKEELTKAIAAKHGY